MVFSFFKKDPKDAKGRPGAVRRAPDPRSPVPSPKPIGKPLPEPAARLNPARLPSQRFATTENAIPDRELARSLAMETAAKIDRIESEMARDFLRPRGAAANTGAPPVAPVAEAAAPPNGTPAAVEVDDTAGDDFLGSVDAIEIQTSGTGSVIDESAILFANGRFGEAEQVLRAGIAADDLGHATQNAWLMLLELLNQRGDRAAFEQLAAHYAVRFQSAAPAWIAYESEPAPPAAAPTAPAVGGPPVVRLPVTVDANVVKTLEQLKTLAASHAALTMDASAVRSIDLVGAELLLRVVTAFKRAAHELTIAGVEQLLAPLRALVEPGRRDASDAAWMLLLEVLRLLGRQTEFEETGIQYCITFEVSPPQWEPPPPNIKVGEAIAATAEPAVPAAPAEEAALAWRGVIEGEGEPWFGRLALEARHQKRLTVEALQLRRMAFSAGSALLTLLMRLQQAGVTVEFRNVNPLLGALFHLLGITAVAGVQLRRP